jgi:RNA polymerase sigma factor (sigma-70 family)
MEKEKDNARSDEELVRLSQDGRRDAFAQLVHRHYRPVFRYLLFKLRDYHAAEDVTQETFFRAYIKIKSCKQVSRFAGWLFMVAKDQCYKWCLRNKDRYPVAPRPLEEDEGVFRDESTILDLREGIMNLPEPQRMALSLKYGKGLTCEEVAKIMGKPLSTVKSLIFRAYQRLRRRLKER